MKIIRKPDIINQKCKICNTEVELTHKEIKKKVWKCPFCGQKNNVKFVEVVADTTKPTTSLRSVFTRGSDGLPMCSYVKKNPPTIKILNYKSYGIVEMREDVATKLLELIINGFNTNQRLSKATGLKPSSCSRYCSYLKNHGLIGGTNSTGYWVLSHVKYERINWRLSK